MKKRDFVLWLVGATIGSFVCGFMLHLVVTFDPHSGEPRQSELEVLRQEASGFFYDTMRELFERTYDPQESHVSPRALDIFDAYRPKLQPRCWLVNVYPQYGTFYGEVLFPSGDVFEVGMQKNDKGWVLVWLNHMGTKYFYRDLSDKAVQ